MACITDDSGTRMLTSFIVLKFFKDVKIIK
jgi:hypothetical protein